MPKKENIKTLMESIKWNLAVGKMIGTITSVAEEEMIAQIRTLAWVLGDNDISYVFPNHYDKEGSHQTGASNAKDVYRGMSIELEIRRIKEGVSNVSSNN